ncbi:MAG TPA: PDGLE domain-containing protein [Patescibacteria group bacterium]|nr:PDGLE domain-containing protein [Patescibacteria group bacterium]
MKMITKLRIAIMVLVLVAPLGLLLPHYFKAGPAWGEWGVQDIRSMIGYVPAGLQKFFSLWHAPLAEYGFRGWAGKGLFYQSLAYVFSGAIGVAVTALIVLFIGKKLSRKD